LRRLGKKRWPKTLKWRKGGSGRVASADIIAILRMLRADCEVGHAGGYERLIRIFLRQPNPSERIWQENAKSTT